MNIKYLIFNGWIQQSLSPCVVLVLLVPKKDGSWCMCTDCRAINNITVKYCHHISRLDDMLDELHGVVCFSKIDMHMVIIKSVLKLMMSGKQPLKLTKFGLYECLLDLRMLLVLLCAL